MLSPNSKILLWCGPRKIQPPFPLEFHVTNVRRCDSRKAKARKLYPLKLADVGASSGLSGKDILVHRRKSQLVTNQNLVSDAQETSLKARAY
jgi:hypothetical protein